MVAEIRLGFVDRPNQVIGQPLFEALERENIKVDHPHSGCHAIWNASVLNYEKAKRLREALPDVKFVDYVWDFYEWAWNLKRPQEIYDWKGYGEYLKGQDALWCPNVGTALRLKEYLDKDAQVIHTGVNVWSGKPKNGGYVLQPLRDYPEVNLGLTRKTCVRLDIPYKEPMHRLPYEDFKKLVDEATVITSEYYEASTGGLTLIEGLWNGKPSLVSNSPYQGGREYLGKFGYYFQWDDKSDFETRLREMFENPPVINIEEARDYITQNFTYEKMARGIREHLEKLL